MHFMDYADRAPRLIATRVGELRHDLFEVGEDRGSLAERHGDIEFVQTTLQRRPGELYTFRAGYLFTGARQDPLIRIEEFLEEFFARTEANEFEFRAGFAGEANQSLRQVRDPNRLSHVKHQDVAVPADRKGLQHEADRFGNCHEKAGDLGVSDGDGQVLTDLFLEERNHAAVRSEDVAESDRHTAQPLPGPGCENQFSHPLGAAHDVRRIHRLVGRNHYEGRAIRTLCHVQQRQQSENIVADRLFPIGLHYGHVLVGGGMEDDLNPIGKEYSAHAFRVAEVGDTKCLALAVLALGKLMLQMKDSGFILVEAHKKFRFVRPDLTAQFGTNGSRGTSHHDHAVPNMLPHRFQIEVDRDTPQKIRERNFPNLLQDDSTRDQFRHGRDGSKRSGCFFTDCHQATHLDRGSRWNRNQDFVDSLLADYFRQSLDGAKHRHAQNSQAFLEWIVIDATDHPTAGLYYLGFPNDRLGGMSGANQE